MRIYDIINQPEGRRLEFKETLPAKSDIAKTIVAFSNDAGGELVIGVRNQPRELVGVAEDERFKIEEKINDVIFDHCHPIIIPEITFHSIDNKHFIRVQVYKGNNLPYYLKEKGKLKGTYIRVGSSNRLADQEIIEELERQKRKISFDSEINLDKTAEEVDLSNFSNFYKGKTGEDLTSQSIRKLDLFKEYQGKLHPDQCLHPFFRR